MKRNTQYSKAVIETNELIENLLNYLAKQGKIIDLDIFLLEIQKKALLKIDDSLNDRMPLKSSIDNSNKNMYKKYWEGVYDMTKLARKQWLNLKDDVMFRLFLTNCIPTFNTIIASDENIDSLDGLNDVLITQSNANYDPVYIQTSLRTLNIIERLLTSVSQKQKINNFITSIKQMELKAKKEIISDTSSLTSNQDYKPKEYWQAIYDMARIIKNQWLSLQNAQQVQEFIKKLNVFFIRQKRIQNIQGDELLDTQDLTIEGVYFPEATDYRTKEGDSLNKKPKLVSIDSEMFQEALNFLSDEIHKQKNELLPEKDENIEIINQIIEERTVSNKQIDKATALREALSECGFDLPQESKTSTEKSLPNMLLSDDLLKKGSNNKDEEDEDDLLTMALRNSLKILKDME